MGNVNLESSRSGEDGEREREREHCDSDGRTDARAPPPSLLLVASIVQDRRTGDRLTATQSSSSTRPLESMPTVLSVSRI